MRADALRVGHRALSRHQVERQEMRAMEQLRARMESAERSELLALLATAINELTIHGRAHYDSPDMTDRLRETNEAVHRLAGHLRDLCDPNEAYTASRADGVAEQLRLLHPSSIRRIYGDWS
jgi:hypothetical protein